MEGDFFVRNEMQFPEKPNFSSMTDIPPIIISDVEDMQVGFMLSSSSSEVENIYGITHAHDTFELQYIDKNNVEILIENTRKVTLHEGDILLLPPHMHHKTCTHSQEFEGYCINFAILPNMNCTDAQTFNWYEQALSSLDQEIVFQNTEIQHFVHKIFKSQMNSSVCTFKTNLYLNLIFAEIITQLTRQDMHTVANTQQNKVVHKINMQRKWMIETYVSQCYMYRNHTENLSQILGLSPRQASRVIKELTGCTPQELILGQRMTVAMEAIKFSDMSLTQISDMLGYSTYYGFYTAFCKYYGFSPEQSGKYAASV